jgi:hypothetical protein
MRKLIEITGPHEPSPEFGIFSLPHHDAVTASESMAFPALRDDYLEIFGALFPTIEMSL